MDKLDGSFNPNISQETFISLQDDLAYGFVVALVVMSALNVILHSIGTFLCFEVYKRQTNNSIQILYLLNLSITQTLASIVVLIDESSELIYDKMEITKRRTVLTLQELDVYLYIIIYVLFCVYYVDMIVITLNRFFEVYLSIRYPVYWNITKSKYLLCVVWMMCVCTCVTMSVIYRFNHFNYHFLFTEIVSPLFNVLFLIIAFVSYVYIFHQFRRSRTRFPSIRSVSTEKRESIYTTLRNSNFHLCALLVGSFIIFVVAPNLPYLFHSWAGAERSHAAKDAIKVSYQMSFLVDFVIYVIMQADVRCLCLKKLRKCWCFKQRKSDNVVESQTSFL